MIRYLGPEEKPLCRPLWEEAFPEDTREFLDNYFERKMKENRVLAALDGESGPGIMARVVNAQAFLSGFGVNGDCPCLEMEVPLVIWDAQIKENNGLFCWRLNANGSTLRRSGASGGVGPDGAGLLVSSEALALTPGQLAAWLWGYRTLEELEPDSGIPDWCEFVRTLQGVFLDEVV